MQCTSLNFNNNLPSQRPPLAPTGRREEALHLVQFPETPRPIYLPIHTSWAVLLGARSKSPRLNHAPTTTTHPVSQ